MMTNIKNFDYIDLSNNKVVSGVYCIINSYNNKIYIGSSKHIVKRIKNHICNLNNNKHNNTYLQSAWNKYGESLFKFALLCECKTDDLRLIEQNFLDIFQPYNDIGYNLNKVSSYPLNPEVTAIKFNKLRLGNKNFLGKKHSEETKAKIAQSRVGRFIKETNPFYGKKHSDETRKIMSNNSKNSRKILQYDVGGKLVKEWNSITEAASFFSGHRQNIRYAIKKNSTAYGHKWEYKVE
jgi:group I intron endonuclease